MNVYSCLLFQDRPDLHMTLRYRRGLGEEDVSRWSEELVRQFGDTVQFDVALPSVRQLGGPTRRVRTLACDARELRGSVPDEAVPGGWLPHVTCEDEPPLRLRVLQVGLRHRQSTLFTWNLLP